LQYWGNGLAGGLDIAEIGLMIAPIKG